MNCCFNERNCRVSIDALHLIMRLVLFCVRLMWGAQPHNESLLWPGLEPKQSQLQAEHYPTEIMDLVRCSVDGRGEILPYDPCLTWSTTIRARHHLLRHLGFLVHRRIPETEIAVVVRCLQTRIRRVVLIKERIGDSHRCNIWYQWSSDIHCYW